MCVILVAETSRISKSEHKDAAAVHRDGIGIVWRDRHGKGWKYFKGTTQRAYEIAARLAQRVPLPYAMHYRMASSGGHSEKLAQPFPIADALKPTRGRMAQGIMHNGHWYKGDRLADAMHEIDGTPWSDTRICAAMLANRPKGKAWKKVISDVGGKIVLFKGDGTMMLYGTFVRDRIRGISRSNEWHLEPWWEKGRDYNPKTDFYTPSGKYGSGYVSSLNHLDDDAWRDVSARSTDDEDTEDDEITVTLLPPADGTDYEAQARALDQANAALAGRNKKAKPRKRHRRFWHGNRGKYTKY